MTIRKKGRNRVSVAGREFSYYVHNEIDVRIASVDKKFVVSYRWLEEPVVTVSGQKFPGLASDRPVRIRPPDFDYKSPAGLARQVIN